MFNLIFDPDDDPRTRAAIFAAAAFDASAQEIAMPTPTRKPLAPVSCRGGEVRRVRTPEGVEWTALACIGGDYYEVGAGFCREADSALALGRLAIRGAK